MQRFLDAVEMATVWILNNPDEAWAVFAKTDPKLDDALNKQAWKDTLPRLAASPAALDRKRYSRFAEFMKARGLIEKVEPVERYAVVALNRQELPDRVEVMDGAVAPSDPQPVGRRQCGREIRLRLPHG